MQYIEQKNHVIFSIKIKEEENPERPINLAGNKLIGAPETQIAETQKHKWNPSPLSHQCNQ